MRHLRDILLSASHVDGMRIKVSSNYKYEREGISPFVVVARECTHLELCQEKMTGNRSSLVIQGPVKDFKARHVSLCLLFRFEQFREAHNMRRLNRAHYHIL